MGGFNTEMARVLISCSGLVDLTLIALNCTNFVQKRFTCRFTKPSSNSLIFHCFVLNILFIHVYVHAIQVPRHSTSFTSTPAAHVTSANIAT